MIGVKMRRSVVVDMLGAKGERQLWAVMEVVTGGGTLVEGA